MTAAVHAAIGDDHPTVAQAVAHAIEEAVLVAVGDHPELEGDFPSHPAGRVSLLGPGSPTAFTPQQARGARAYGTAPLGVAASTAVRAAHAAVADAQCAAMDAVRAIMEEVQRQLDGTSRTTRTKRGSTARDATAVGDDDDECAVESGDDNGDAPPAARAAIESMHMLRLAEQQTAMEARLERERELRAEERHALEAQLRANEVEAQRRFDAQVRPQTTYRYYISCESFSQFDSLLPRTHLC